MVIIMGMLACYMEADKTLLDQFKDMDNDKLGEELSGLEENGELEVCDIDKMWDGLHYLLTGVSADTPIENNLLSQAVVGERMFIDDEQADFIAYISPNRISEIFNAMNLVDFEKLRTSFSVKDFAKKEIYPNIWMNENSNSLFEELINAFNELKKFYCSVNDKGLGVIVTII